MQKVYPASAVANFLIKKSLLKPENAMTHLRLQKLLYYAQGWFLANYSRPLFQDNIEAWRYGPVVYSIYKKFRGSSDTPIQETIKSPYFLNGQYQWGEPEIDPSDEVALGFLNSFWDAFSNFDAWTLANATHLEGTPWYDVSKVYNFEPPRNTDIPIDMIENHFKNLMPAQP